jgi:hypothetical protein
VRLAWPTPWWWYATLGFASSPSVEVWRLLEVWWVMDGYDSRVWVVL